MDIIETFQNHFGSGNASTHDFTLVEYSPDFFIGIDNFDHVCVVVKSSGLHRFPIKYKTQKISIECNMKVCYELNGKQYDDTVHIIRCLSEVKQEKCILRLGQCGIHRGRFIYQYCQIKFCGGSKCLRHMICLTIVT